MTLDVAPLRQRRQQAMAVLLRQRAFIDRLWGSPQASSRPAPIERVLRRTAYLPTVQRLTVHAWMVQPVLPQHHTVVERHRRVETQHRGAPTERVLRSPDRLHETTLRERLLHHTITLLQRHTEVATVARAFKTNQAAPAPDKRTHPPSWQAAQVMPRLNTTLLTTNRPSAAVQAPRTPSTTDRDAHRRRPASLAGVVATPLVLPAQEMSRVTEHVLQQLDRRFLSHRERHGRT